MKNTCACLFTSLVTSAALANPAHDLIFKASELKRSQAFADLLTASGKRCPSVNRTFYQGSAKNGAAFWNVSCSNGQSYVIQLENNNRGSSQILDCAVLKAVNAGTCFKKF